jgi:hypothetical protein
MRPPLRITRDHALAELRGALRQTARASAQLRLRALLAVAQGEHVPGVAQLLHVAQRAGQQVKQAGGPNDLVDRPSATRCLPA